MPGERWVAATQQVQDTSYTSFTWDELKKFSKNSCAREKGATSVSRSTWEVRMNRHALTLSTEPRTTSPATFQCKDEKWEIGSCPGSLGELWQGPWPGSTQAEVAVMALHTQLQSWATIWPGDTPVTSMGSTLRASVATAFQEVTGKGEVNGEFSFESSIPVGAGMSSWLFNVERGALVGGGSCGVGVSA